MVGLDMHVQAQNQCSPQEGAEYFAANLFEIRDYQTRAFHV